MRKALNIVAVFVVIAAFTTGVAIAASSDLGTCTSPNNYKACMVKCSDYDSCITCCGHFDAPWYETCKSRCKDRFKPCEMEQSEALE